MPAKHLIIVAGPTAIGKTALSVALAKHYHCPVLSADSRQFFKEMTIGTAKPTEEEMQGVKHYFIDSHSITEEYNVGKFETEALALLEQLFQKHDKIILTGGSGLYIDAICKGFDELPEADAEIREQISTLYKNEGLPGLQNLLQKLDPDYYSSVDLQNPQRISRALEVCLAAGAPYSTLRKGKSNARNFKTIKIGLNTDREILYNRINARVDIMMEQGLLKEAENLLPYRHLNALQTVGYKELFDFFDKKTDLKTAVELIKQNTRRFAKRQLTWFRRDAEMKWFAPEQGNAIIAYIDSSVIPGEAEGSFE
jgi:tRNA dimethylallyltransferase